MKLNCEIIAVSDVEHLQQIYTGFSLLHQKGLINLKQTIPNECLQNKNQPNRWLNYEFFNTQVIINNKISVCYDTHDWNWIDKKILGKVDFYFKRSYDESYLLQIEEKHKVFPLGLNYQVTNDKLDLYRLKRSSFYNGKQKLKNVVKAFRLDNFLPADETERLDRMNAAPNFDLLPKVLFMARAWDVENIPDQSQKLIVKEINETRAEAIRLLRQQFGDNFYGGLLQDKFSRTHFKDVLLPDELSSNKRNYLKMMKDFSICVATRGLNNSNGWKLAEYVAFSKAIVTESLYYQVPGDFEEGKNYLEFTSPDELSNAVSLLFEATNLRNSMMDNNYKYYQKFLRPDALVLNTLKIVSEHSGVSLENP